MLQNINYESLGLPLPTCAEAFPLKCFQRIPTLDTARDYIAAMAQSALAQHTLMASVIEDDVDLFRQKERPVVYLDDEVDAYIEGVRTGYQIVIGSFTHIFTERAKNIEEVAIMLPVRSRTAFDFITNVRAGKGAVDITNKLDEYGEVQNSYDVATRFAEEYLHSAEQMVAVIETWCPEECTYDVESALSDGVWHGARNAVSMFALSHEVELLAEFRTW